MDEPIKDSFRRRLLRGLAFAGVRLFVPCTVLGGENVPDPKDGPLLLVSNHFSYFEAPLICSLLYHNGFYGFASPDAMSKSKFIANLYNAHPEQIILIKRGAVDRQALQRGLKALQNDWLMLFPEGGVTAESVGMAVQGESANKLEKRSYTRDPAELFPPRAGSAMLATQSQAKILPIAVWGTEKALPRAKRLRRTHVTMSIGAPLDPMTTPEGLRGRERRAHMDAMSEKIMQAIAALMPEAYRGPYRSE